MTSSSRSTAISQEEWEEHKEEIVSLFQDHTYTEIRNHLRRTHGFFPRQVKPLSTAQLSHQTRDQFGTQVQKRWKLTKNVKRKDQHDAFVQAQERGETPTEALIGDRMIPWKKIRKTALAMSSAQRKGELRVVETSARQQQHAQAEQERTYLPVSRFDSIITEDPYPLRTIIPTEPALEETRSSSFAILPPFSLPQRYMVPMPDSEPYPVSETASFHAPDSSSVPPSAPDISKHQQPYFQTAIATPVDELNATIRVNPENIHRYTGLQITPNISDLAHEVILCMQAETDPSQNDDESFSIHRFAAILQLLRHFIIITTSQMGPKKLDVILNWISKARLLWVLGALMHNKAIRINQFARRLFNSAVITGNVGVVVAMLENGIEVNERLDAGNNRELSPLQIAIGNTNPALVRALLDRGAIINNSTVVNSSTGTHIAQTDLELATQQAYISLTMIRLLLDHGANVNVPIQQSKGFTSVLNRALRLNDIELARMLLSHGALVNDHQCGQSITALQTAAKYCGSETIKLLIDAGADINVPIAQSYDIARKVAARVRNSDFFVTPLQHAAMRNDMAMVQILLDNHAFVGGYNFNSAFPRSFVFHNTDVGFDAWDDEPNENFELAIYFSYLEPYPTDTDPSRDGLSFLERETAVYSPLQAAAANKNIAMVKLLLEHDAGGFRIDFMGGLGTALQVACLQHGNLDIVRLLIDEGASINTRPRILHGRTALQAAILSGDEEMAIYLINQGADVNSCATTIFGRTALQAAAKLGNVDLVQRLIEVGADVNEETSKVKSDTCLHLAVRSDNVPLVDLLLEHKANVNVTREATGSLLNLAIRSGNHFIVARLMANGAQLSQQYDEDIDQDYLCDAVEEGNYQLVQTLLKHGADSNVPTTGRGTPLKAAVQYGTPDMLNLLLDNGATLDTLDTETGSGLPRAIIEYDFARTQSLFHDRPVDALRNDDELLLAAAISTFNVRLVHLMIEQGLNLNEKAAYESLVHTIRCGGVSILEILLTSGKVARWVDYSGPRLHSPLSLAIERREYGAINALLAHDTAFYTKDSSALLQAVKNQDLALVERLLSLTRRPADSPASRNYADELDEARSRGDNAIVEALLAARTPNGSPKTTEPVPAIQADDQRSPLTNGNNAAASWDGNAAGPSRGSWSASVDVDASQAKRTAGTLKERLQLAADLSRSKRFILLAEYFEETLRSAEFQYVDPVLEGAILA